MFKSIVTPVRTNTGFVYNNYRNQFWNRTPADLPLKANPMDLLVTNLQLTTQRNYADPGNTLGGLAYSTTPLWSGAAYRLHMDGLVVNASNRAYSAFVQALRAGDAGVGVTLASYRQTWEMIALRCNTIRDMAKHAEAVANAHKRTIRQRMADNRRATRRGMKQPWKPKDLLPIGSANVFLEGLFGWIPLVSSIKEGAKILASEPPYEPLSRSRKSYKTFPTTTHGDAAISFQVCIGTARVCQSALVRLNNPNVWLANQAGLINPAVVALDIVPWSFVVNMFVNVNSLLNSYTDFFGLDVTDASTTTRRDYHETFVLRKVLWVVYYIQDTRVFNDYTKTRTIGLTAPQLEFRLPKITMTNALMACALMVQQVSGLKYIRQPGILRA